VLWRIG